MSPNCQACDDGNHAGCIVEWCECRQKGRHEHRTLPMTHEDVVLEDKRIDMQTGETIPNYVALDLWMALGFEPNHEFDDAIAVRGVVDVWSWLLQHVRDLNNGLKRIEREETKAAGSLGVTENGDPMYLRAKAAVEAFSRIERVDMDVTYDDVVTTADGRVVHGVQQCEVRIVGPVR